MKVLLLTKYSRKGASSRVRSLQYLPALRSKGLDVDVRPLFPESYLDAIYDGKTPKTMLLLAGAYLRRFWALWGAQGQYDLLWIEKELLPWIPYIAERLLLPAKAPLLIDYDDAVFVRYERSASAVIRWSLDGKIAHSVQSASLVLAGSETLAEELTQRGAREICVIPSSVCVAKYPSKPTVRTEPPYRIGWIGSPSTAKYLVDIAEPLERLTADRDTEVMVIGANNLALGDTRVQYREWSERSEAEMLSEIDVGVMPLPANAWTAGKCGYKLIQYMAAWKPVVASPVGANRAIVRHERNGYLAASNDEWFHYLSRLKNDAQLRQRLGREGRRQVEASYATEVNVERLERAIREAAASG